MAVSTEVRLTGDRGTGPELLCPRCGSNYMHQGKVTVFDRVGGEEALWTDVTTVDNGLAATHRLSSDASANPSRRRQGVAIELSCEGCGDGIELLIAQEEGKTVLSWRFDPQTKGEPLPAD